MCKCTCPLLLASSAKKKKDPFCRSGKHASSKDNEQRKLFPKQRKKRAERERPWVILFVDQTVTEEFNVGASASAEVGASAQKLGTRHNHWQETRLYV